MTASRRLRIVALAAALLWVPRAWAGDKALELYDKGRYDEAAQRFAEQAEKKPDDALTHYNYGAAAYKANRFEPGASALSRAQGTASPELQQKAAYNLGNTRYRMGQAKEPSSPEAAAKLYGQALDEYQTAIRLDPNDRDAQYNYELVKRRLDQLKAQQAQQKQDGKQKKQDDKQEEGQDQSAKNAQPQPGEQGSSRPQQSGGDQQDAGQRGQDQEKEEPVGQDEAAQQQDQRQSSATDGSGDEQDPQEKEGSNVSGGEEKPAADVSKQEALWILDTLKSEEARAPRRDPADRARDTMVDQDW